MFCHCAGCYILSSPNNFWRCGLDTVTYLCWIFIKYVFLPIAKIWSLSGNACMNFINIKLFCVRISSLKYHHFYQCIKPRVTKFTKWHTYCSLHFINKEEYDWQSKLYHGWKLKVNERLHVVHLTLFVTYWQDSFIWWKHVHLSGNAISNQNFVRQTQISVLFTWFIRWNWKC